MTPRKTWKYASGSGASCMQVEGMKMWLQDCEVEERRLAEEQRLIKGGMEQGKNE